MLQMQVGDLLVIGITRENVTRLVQGKPMLFTPRWAAKEISIVFGEDKPAIIAQLEKAGAVFHPEMKASAERDPL